MAYDEALAERIRERLAGAKGVAEQRMFGGLAFLINGNMSVAASGQGGMLVRADPEQADAWVDGTHVAPMVMRGREMTGWLMVDAAAVAGDPELDTWVDRGATYARSLPPKQAKKR